MYPYGITSLADKRDFLQKGDSVRFQLALNKLSGTSRAVNIAAIRKFIRARVDSVKGQVRLISPPILFFVVYCLIASIMKFIRATVDSVKGHVRLSSPPM